MAACLTLASEELTAAALQMAPGNVVRVLLVFVVMALIVRTLTR